MKNSDNNTIAGVVLTKNAADTLTDTLESLGWVNRLMVIDNGSEDNSVKISEKYTDLIIKTDCKSFATNRSLAIKELNTDWILYIDADEVVSLKLADEIKEAINEHVFDAYQIQRTNYFLGRRMYSDMVTRLFYKPKLKSWSGEVHESPVFDGKLGMLTSPIIHYSHKDIESMLQKTNEWSEIEADLRVKTNHPPIKIWRIVRIVVTFVWSEYFAKRMWRYGREGLFEAYFQVVDKLIVYTKLWERQRKHEAT